MKAREFKNRDGQNLNGTLTMPKIKNIPENRGLANSHQIR